MDPTESDSTGGIQKRQILTPVNGLLVVIAILLLAVVGLLLRGAGEQQATDSKDSKSRTTVSVEEGGYTYSAPTEMTTVKWGEEAEFPDGMAVRATDLQPSEGSGSGGESQFKYRVEFTNRSDEVLSTLSATYRLFVNEGSKRPCSVIKGPPDMLPPSGTVRQGQTISGWVGAGCPAGTASDAPFSLEIGQHSEIPSAVEFVP